MAFTRRETALLLLGDFALLVLSLWLALFVRTLTLPSPHYFYFNLVNFLWVFVVSVFIFFIAGLYEKQTRLVKRTMGGRILGAQMANVILAAILFFLLPFAIAPKTILVLYFVISVLLISAWRFFITPRISYLRPERALLIGQGPLIGDVYDEVNNNRKYRIRFTERIDTATVSSHTITERIYKAVEEGARRVVLDTRDGAVRPQIPMLYRAMLSGVVFIDFATFYEELFDRVPFTHVDHAWLLENLPKKRFVYDFTKRAIDVGGSIIGMCIAIFFVLPAALVLLCNGGTPFIFHERVGRYGETFNIMKLRTMLIADDEGDPELQKKNRITRVGWFLRRSRIDELPQLWNIFLGELSFIGPRPELPKIAAIYEEEIPFYEVRHLITPGLSGWAQILDFDAPKGLADVARTERKLSYDLYYLKHRSLGLDIVIALKTFRALLSFSGK